MRNSNIIPWRRLSECNPNTFFLDSKNYDVINAITSTVISPSLIENTGSENLALFIRLLQNFARYYYGDAYSTTGKGSITSKRFAFVERELENKESIIRQYEDMISNLEIQNKAIRAKYKEKIAQLKKELKASNSRELSSKIDGMRDYLSTVIQGSLYQQPYSPYTTFATFPAPYPNNYDSRQYTTRQTERRKTEDRDRDMDEESNTDKKQNNAEFANTLNNLCRTIENMTVNNSKKLNEFQSQMDTMKTNIGIQLGNLRRTNRQDTVRGISPDNSQFLKRMKLTQSQVQEDTSTSGSLIFNQNKRYGLSQSDVF